MLTPVYLIAQNAHPMADKQPVNVTLSEEALSLCSKLVARLGVSRSSVIEMSVRDYAEARGITDSSPTPQTAEQG